MKIICIARNYAAHAEELDRQVGGGFGIMLDDIIAGAWAALCICMYFYFTSI